MYGFLKQKEGIFFFFTALNTFFFFFKIFEQERQFLQNTVHQLIGKLLQNRELSQRKGREVRVLQNCCDACMSTHLSASTNYPQKQVVWFNEQ